MEKVIQVMCDIFGITKEELLCGTKKSKYVNARTLFIFVMNTKYGMSANSLCKMIKVDRRQFYRNLAQIKSIVDKDDFYKSTLQEFERRIKEM